MTDEDLNDKAVRPMVRKHYRTFAGYVRGHGAAFVRELLLKGRSGRYKLVLLHNRKDVIQMADLLGLRDSGKRYGCVADPEPEDPAKVAESMGRILSGRGEP